MLRANLINADNIITIEDEFYNKEPQIEDKTCYTHLKWQQSKVTWNDCLQLVTQLWLNVWTHSETLAVQIYGQNRL